MSLIFKKELIRKVRVGQKTQTRQPIQPHHDLRHPPWKVGRTYAVQPACGKKATARIVVAGVHTESLGALSFEDALLEGAKTRDEFYDRWKDSHGAVDLAQLVWVITFTVDNTDHPRLLARNPTALRADYTDNPHQAAREEPEALTEGQLEKLGHLNLDAERVGQLRPLRTSQLAIARELDAIREHLAVAPDREIASAVRGVERQLRTLGRRLRAGDRAA